jgi:hypothetical protein
MLPASAPRRCRSREGNVKYRHASPGPAQVIPEWLPLHVVSGGAPNDLVASDLRGDEPREDLVEPERWRTPFRYMVTHEHPAPGRAIGRLLRGLGIQCHSGRP